MNNWIQFKKISWAIFLVSCFLVVSDLIGINVSKNQANIAANEIEGSHPVTNDAKELAQKLTSTPETTEETPQESYKESPVISDDEQENLTSNQALEPASISGLEQPKEPLPQPSTPNQSVAIKEEIPVVDQSNLSVSLDPSTAAHTVSETTNEDSPKTKRPKAYNDIVTEDGELSSIQTCQVENLGVQFKCDLNWKVIDEDNPESSQVIVLEDPLVMLEWQKYKQDYRFLVQLNRYFFEDTGLYASGFRIEDSQFAGYKAFLIKGTDKEDERLQRRDYYYLYNNKLIRVSFISEKKKWDLAQWPIKEVKDSFSAYSL